VQEHQKENVSKLSCNSLSNGTSSHSHNASQIESHISSKSYQMLTIEDHIASVLLSSFQEAASLETQRRLVNISESISSTIHSATKQSSGYNFVTHFKDPLQFSFSNSLCGRLILSNRFFCFLSKSISLGCLIHFSSIFFCFNFINLICCLERDEVTTTRDMNHTVLSTEESHKTMKEIFNQTSTFQQTEASSQNFTPLQFFLKTSGFFSYITYCILLSNANILFYFKI
jgi:hypothetical protein